MSELKFTEDHEWLAIEGNCITVGITHHAREQLGDIVFVELPEAGQHYNEGDEAAVIESVKAAGEINMPVSGTVADINEALSDDPELLNSDPMGDGWFFKITISDDYDLPDLMTKDQYEQFIADH